MAARIRAAHTPSAAHQSITTIERPNALYVHELKDLYSAEKQIIAVLPKIVKAASNEQLAAGFMQLLEQTKEHAARLERILSSHNQTTRGSKCKGMEACSWTARR